MILGKFPSVFSLEIHHGGKLSQAPNRLYDGGKVNWFDQIDSDGFSVVEVNQMLKCLGYLNPKMEYWYKMPDKDALLSLSNDNDVLRFIKYVDRYKLMQLYVVHPVDKPKLLGDNEVTEETFDPLFCDLDPETGEPNATEFHSEVPNVTEPSEVPNVTEPSEVPNGPEPSEIPNDAEDVEDSDDSDFDVELEDMIEDVEVDMDDFRKYTDENVEWVGRNEVPVEDTQPVDAEVFEDLDLEDFDSASDPDDIECNRKKALRMLAKKHKPVDGNIYSENFYCGQTFANKELIKQMVSSQASSRTHLNSSIKQALQRRFGIMWSCLCKDQLVMIMEDYSVNIPLNSLNTKFVQNLRLIGIANILSGFQKQFPPPTNRRIPPTQGTHSMVMDDVDEAPLLLVAIREMQRRHLESDAETEIGDNTIPLISILLDTKPKLFQLSPLLVPPMQFLKSNKLRQQLQGKLTLSGNIDARSNIMKELMIQLDGLKVENVSLKKRYDELSKANTHSRTAYTENTKLKAQVTGTTSSGPSTSETPKVLAPGMYNLGSKYIPPPKRANWVKPTPLPKKRQVTFSEPPRLSLKPTQKPVVQPNKQTNVCVPIFRSNSFWSQTKCAKRAPRNHSSLPVKSANARRVEAHHRTLNKKNRVDSNLLVKHSVSVSNLNNVCGACSTKLFYGTVTWDVKTYDGDSWVYNFVEKVIGYSEILATIILVTPQLLYGGFYSKVHGTTKPVLISLNDMMSASPFCCFTKDSSTKMKNPHAIEEVYCEGLNEPKCNCIASSTIMDGVCKSSYTVYLLVMAHKKAYRIWRQSNKKRRLRKTFHVAFDELTEDAAVSALVKDPEPTSGSLPTKKKGRRFVSWFDDDGKQLETSDVVFPSMKSLTHVEPKTYKQALEHSCWIEAMQEEIHEFERLDWAKGYRQEAGIDFEESFAPVARLEAIALHG
ncbi:hypothetical protein Tco_0684272 [Tanacetum coccineum]